VQRWMHAPSVQSKLQVQSAVNCWQDS